MPRAVILVILAVQSIKQIVGIHIKGFVPRICQLLSKAMQAYGVYGVLLVLTLKTFCNLDTIFLHHMCVVSAIHCLQAAEFMFTIVC